MQLTLEGRGEPGPGVPRGFGEVDMAAERCAAEVGAESEWECGGVVDSDLGVT